jgi:hypothetical protein
MIHLKVVMNVIEYISIYNDFIFSNCFLFDFLGAKNIYTKVYMCIIEND